MAAHDIIDNRNEKLVDHIKQILQSSERAKFAVGYFFLSGFEAIGKSLESIKELCLLIGNTSTRETIEQISEGYKRLELAQDRIEDLAYAKRIERKQRAENTARNLKETIEVMDQTDEAEGLIFSLIKMIEEQRLKVRVYTKGRLHAKAYIFDYLTPNPGNEGIAIVGSSNLTLAGIEHNTELNVIVYDKGSPVRKGQGNHRQLSAWFNELWDEAEDFEAHLMNELKQSWAAHLVKPYDIYMKTLYALVKERLEGAEGKEILWDDEITRDLADFQKTAVRQAIQKIRDNRGAFVADVVGLGKSYIGAAIIKHFERTERARALIICPKTLEEMWTGYNETYQLNAHILSMSMLLEAPDRGVNLFEDVRYRDRDFVLVDESHNFRHHTNQRYSVLQSFLSTGRKVCLLTATPRNSSALDVYNQIKLFHPEDITYLPIDPPNLKEYFKMVINGQRKLQDLLSQVMIRRMRRHILQWYGYAGDTNLPLRELSDVERQQYLSGKKRAYVMVGGKHQYFPVRELKTLRYSIEASYNGLYENLRKCLGRPQIKKYNPQLGEELTYARYGLWNFVVKPKRDKPPYNELKRAGINLRGLMRTMLFKRLESSVHAFRESIRRIIRTHEIFLKSLEKGFVPAGDKVEELIGRGSAFDETELLDAIESLSGRYDLNDFEAPRLAEYIKADLQLLHKMYRMVEPITAQNDDKFQKLLEHLNSDPVNSRKCLIFTQFADTAKYLYENLNPGDKQKDIDFIYGTDKSKARVVGRFAPKANPQFKFQKGDMEIRWLVATDVLAEGLNMQDCDVVLNYDLHWNPVRLIQRLGRIDRIGSEHQTIWALNFLPETELEKTLNIHVVLHRRIQEIHDTIGEDAKILDESERLNTEAMYAIYETKGNQMLLFGEDEEDAIDLNEAEELLRNLAKNNPDEFERIVKLRDGIRSGLSSTNKGMFVFCEQGNFQQLVLVDTHGNIKTRDISEILGVIKAGEDEKPPQQLPVGYNQQIMKIKQIFAQEAKHRESQMEYSVSLTQAQRYILRELRTLFERTEDDNIRAQINLIEKAFRMSPTQAVKKELNLIRRNGIVGNNLLKQLSDIYFQHRLEDRLDDIDSNLRKDDIPRIVCSEALL
jgi:superfamily II DNA/RNA helicase